VVMVVVEPECGDGDVGYFPEDYDRYPISYMSITVVLVVPRGVLRGVLEEYLRLSPGTPWDYIRSTDPCGVLGVHTVIYSTLYRYTLSTLE